MSEYKLGCSQNLWILFQGPVVKHAVDQVVELLKRDEEGAKWAHLVFIAMGHFADVGACCHLGMDESFRRRKQSRLAVRF